MNSPQLFNVVCLHIDASWPELQRKIDTVIENSNPRINRNYSKHASRNILERVQPDLDRIDKLARDKVALAKRLVALMSRACGRLDGVIDRAQKASEGSVQPAAHVPTTRITSKLPGTMRAGSDILGPTTFPSSGFLEVPALKRA